MRRFQDGRRRRDACVLDLWSFSDLDIPGACDKPVFTLVVPSPRNSNRPPRPSGSEEDLEPGTILNERYRIDVPIGQGAMGTVYAAEHVLLRKKVALKILRADRALVPEVVARFEREAMAAANIEHPNIAGASDFGRLADGSVYLVLEYVQGRNLRDEIIRGPMAVARSLHIARQVASALVAAEELGIVHRDLKPENVMLIDKLGDPDFVKVLDFGIARVPMAETDDRPLTKAGIVFGTPEYMAPEQALGQRVDGRADLFALGVVLFEMLTGTRPYTNPKNPVLKLAQKPPRLSDRALAQTIPPQLEEIVQKLLAADVRKRFPKATLALSEIDALLGTLGAGAPAPAPSMHPEPPGTNASASSNVAPRLPTFLPGDPLPAFELPSETGLGPPDAQTLLRAPKADASSAPPAHAPSIAPSSSLPPGGSFAARAVALHRAACAFIDAHRERLPRALRRRVKRVPASRLLAVAAGVLSLLLLSLALVVISAVGSPDRDEHAARTEPLAREPPGALGRPSAAPPNDTAPALSAGPADPVNDARALVALAKTRLEEGDEAEALALIGRAIAAEPQLSEDETVRGALSRLLRSEKSSTVDAGLALLEGPMGQRGAEIVYDAAFDTSLSPNVRNRAKAWLKTKDFDRASSPALYSAVKLRLAESCQQKYGLLKLAENVGGKQTLDYLHELAKLTRCPSGSEKACYSCLEEAGRLQETIARLEQRLGS